jgi:hypothetical protein
MFNVQRCYKNREIYINYNELIDDKEDESIPTLEHIIEEGGTRNYKGIIDLITVRSLTCQDIVKLKSLHDILRNGEIGELSVISDSRRVLEHVKSIMPDVSIQLLKIDKRR